MRVSERRGKESASESWPPRSARPILALFAALLVTLTAAPSTDASSAGAFIKAYGWGVSDGASSFETCTATCQEGIGGGGAGQLLSPEGIAADPSGDVYVADQANNRIDEFSSVGAFIKAYGWGVSNGASAFETCTSSCQAGIAGGGAGQFTLPSGVAVDPSATSTSPTNTTTGSTSSLPPAPSSGPTAGASATAPARSRPAPPPARKGLAAAAPGSSLSPRESRPIPRATSTSPTTPTAGSTSSPQPAPSSRPMAGASATGPALLRPARRAARVVSLATAPGSSTLRQPRHRFIGRRLRRRQQPDRRVLLSRRLHQSLRLGRQRRGRRL